MSRTLAGIQADLTQIKNYLANSICPEAGISERIEAGSTTNPTINSKTMYARYFDCYPSLSDLQNPATLPSKERYYDFFGMLIQAYQSSGAIRQIEGYRVEVKLFIHDPLGNARAKVIETKEAEVTACDFIMLTIKDFSTWDGRMLRSNFSVAPDYGRWPFSAQMQFTVQAATLLEANRPTSMCVRTFWRHYRQANECIVL